MAKNIQDLNNSRKQRKEMIRYFGFMPRSILKFSRGTKKFYNFQQETGQSGTYNNPLGPQKIKAFNASAGGTRGGERYSIMPISIVEFVIKYYYDKGDLYCDPFAGQGIQMQIAKSFGIDYVGFDVCEKFVKYIQSTIEQMDDGETRIEVHLKDSRTIGDEAKDWGFCFTSPPYWNIEEYDDSEEQLGVGHTYEEFLQGMTDVYTAMFKQAKNGAVIVSNISDFRKNGKFYSYHADTITCLEKAGFTIHDIGILDGIVTGIAKVFSVSFNKKRILPKIHEYIIVAKAVKS